MICRIDVLWRRWFKGKALYGGAEGIRMEDEDAGSEGDHSD